jgi:hypothetical protein
MVCPLEASSGLAWLKAVSPSGTLPIAPPYTHSEGHRSAMAADR